MDSGGSAGEAAAGGTVIGDVVVTSDGRVTFNGTPLTSDAQHELAQKCQQIDKSR